MIRGIVLHGLLRFLVLDHLNTCWCRLTHSERHVVLALSRVTQCWLWASIGTHLIGIHLIGIHFMGIHLIGIHPIGIHLIGILLILTGVTGKYMAIRYTDWLSPFLPVCMSVYLTYLLTYILTYSLDTLQSTAMFVINWMLDVQMTPTRFSCSLGNQSCSHFLAYSPTFENQVKSTVNISWRLSPYEFDNVTVLYWHC